MNAKTLAYKALEMALIDDESPESTDLVKEVKAKIEELKDQMVAQIEESRPEDAEPEEIDRSKLKVRLPDELLFKILKIWLVENACRNRGYVLEGFPRNFKQAQEVFLIKPKQIVDGEEVEEEEPELEEGEEKSYVGYIPNKDIFPSNFILLEASDEFLMDRVKNFTQDMVENTHYTPEDMKRRLKLYRKWNESEIGEPSLADFFKDSIQVYRESASKDEVEALRGFIIYIERVRVVFIIHL